MAERPRTRRRERAGFWWDVKHNPYPSVVAGPNEAEEILSHPANRGHLLVESRDGALSYALPGRRSEAL